MINHAKQMRRYKNLMVLPGSKMQHDLQKKKIAAEQELEFQHNFQIQPGSTLPADQTTSRCKSKHVIITAFFFLL